MTQPTVPPDPSAEDPRYREIITSIIKRFVRLVGAPAALNVARRIPHLSVDAEGNALGYNRDDPLDTITLLMDEYGSVFGDVAVTLAHQAAKPVAQSADDILLAEAGLLPSSLPSPMRLLLVDDHILFREGLVGLISPQPDMKVVGQASSAKEAIALARDLKPDLILMDISMPDGSGIDAARVIMADAPTAKIMFLTVHSDDEQLFAAVRVGAVGYAFKNVRAAELLKSIRGIGRGEAAISRPIARRILDEFSRMTPQQQRPAEAHETVELTSREIEIVRELAQGASNREIAAKLVISENTVKNHVRNVLSKLRVRSRRDVADYARDHGLASPRSDDQS
ncbi:MAG: response regulator transcription factor [Chloroflexota bacterium]